MSLTFYWQRQSQPVREQIAPVDAALSCSILLGKAARLDGIADKH
jgi:hypothetical protein